MSLNEIIEAIRELEDADDIDFVRETAAVYARDLRDKENRKYLTVYRVDWTCDRATNTTMVWLDSRRVYENPNSSIVAYDKWISDEGYRLGTEEYYEDPKAAIQEKIDWAKEQITWNQDFLNQLTTQTVEELAAKHEDQSP